jgi:hypothetical protein
MKGVVAPGEYTFSQYANYLRDNGAVPGQLVTRVVFNSHKSVNVTAFAFCPAVDGKGNLSVLSAEQQSALADALDSPEMKALLEGSEAGGYTTDVAAPLLAAPVAKPVAAPVAKPVAAPVAPPRATPAPAVQGRYATGDKALAARVQEIPDAEWATLKPWATHATTSEESFREYMDEMYPVVDVAPPVVAPVVVDAVPERPPARPPGRPRKPAAPVVAAASDISSMLGLDDDM